MRPLKSEFVFILLTMRLTWREVSEESLAPALQAAGVSGGRASSQIKHLENAPVVRAPNEMCILIIS